MRLDVVTPKGKLLDAEVDEVTAPGVLGEFGVLPGHIPFLTAIRAGVLSFRGAQGAGTVAVGPGYAQVSNDHVVVLTDVGALVKDIDAQAAQRELAEAQKQLDQVENDPGKHADLESKRNWAQARLDAAGATGIATTH